MVAEIPILAVVESNLQGNAKEGKLGFGKLVGREMGSESHNDFRFRFSTILRPKGLPDIAQIENESRQNAIARKA